LQLHLFLGYFLGSAALHVVHSATGPALAVLTAIVLAGIVFWFTRRGKRLATAGLAEAACPACLTLAYLAERPRDLETPTRNQDETGTEQVAKPAR
jgi:hypothetical protein